jgi:hypothetical protein
MSSAVDPKVLERAARLKALSTSSNENEAANALAALQRLADKHRFKVAGMLDLDALAQQPTCECDKPVFACHKPPAWKVDLLLVLAEYNGCAEFHWTENKTKSYMLAGRPEDIDHVKYLWALTVVVLTRLSAGRFKKSGRGQNAWLLGAVKGIEIQLQAAHTAARAGATTSALSIVDARRDAAVDAIERALGDVPVEPARETRGAKHFAEGLEVGGKLDLGLRGCLR